MEVTGLHDDEIMIGDWVYVLNKFTHQWKLEKVTIDLMQRIKNESWCDEAIIKGVPLTVEIVNDNCSHHHIGSNEYHFYDMPVVVNELSIFVGTYAHPQPFVNEFASFTEIRYVHDLQHALKLVGYVKYKIKVKDDSTKK